METTIVYWGYMRIMEKRCIHPVKQEVLDGDNMTAYHRDCNLNFPFVVESHIM